MTSFAAQPLVHCDPGELTPLPCSGAVSEEEALPIAIAVSVRNECNTLLRQAVTSREVDFRRGKRMYDRLELGGAQYVVVEDALGKQRAIARRRQCDGGHCGGFNQRARRPGGVIGWETLTAPGHIDGCTLMSQNPKRGVWGQR